MGNRVGRTVVRLSCVLCIVCAGCTTEQIALKFNETLESPLFNGGLQKFVSPLGENAEARLIRYQEYQPGKTPVVLVHGLLSDKITWDTPLQALQDDPQISEHYQFWAFVYPTGKSFLHSAALFRSALADEVARLDPDGTDPALHNMVLIGHSMGGLVSKMQITESEETLWSTVSDYPLDELDLDEGPREHIRSLMYFEPSPNVKTAIFIATPHRGSELASSPLGKLGKKIVQFPSEMRDQYRMILADNSDKLKANLTECIPTSIERLSPNDPILQATAKLRFMEGVRIHTIFGKGYLSPNYGDGDGVVSVESARLPNVESETSIEASHGDIHSTAECIAAVKKILRENAQ